MPRLITALTRHTQLCMSLAARPSNIGTRFHNYLYDELSLDFVYKAFTTTDLTSAIAGIRALGVRGCAISMPFKQDSIPLVDEMDSSAAAIDAVNTIVNTAGTLKAYNTDYVAVATLLRDHRVSTDGLTVVLGAGGMARAVVAALRDGGFTDVLVIARDAARGAKLARQYGFSAGTDLGGQPAAVLVNATPIGMAGGPMAEDLAFPIDVIRAARTVFDVVAFPAQTPLIRQARMYGVDVITGAEVIALQAAEQFALYTGVRPTPDQVRRASEFSRE